MTTEAATPLETIKARVTAAIAPLDRGESYLLFRDEWLDSFGAGEAGRAEVAAVRPLVRRLAALRYAGRFWRASVHLVEGWFVVTIDIVPARAESSTVIAIADRDGKPHSLGHMLDGKPETLEWDLELGVGKLATRDGRGI